MLRTVATKISRPSSARLFSTAHQLNKNYGFIGLGAMGLPMAQNLRNALPETDKLTVFDVNPASAAKLTGPNLAIANNVGEVAVEADVLMTMLPEPKHVSGVYSEIVEALKGNQAAAAKLFIDSSTIDVETSLKVAKAVGGAGHSFVDAPVSGGTVGALNGTLTFMVGASEESAQFKDAIEPVLTTMGKRIVPCGGPGLGLVAKLANNYILALTNVATSEAFQIAGSLGLDLALFSQIVNSSTGRSWSSEVNPPIPGVNPTAPSSRDYKNGFGLPLMRKDLGLALDAAKQGNVGLLLGETTFSAYKHVEAANEYYRTRDMSVIYKYIEDQKAGN